MIGNNSPIRVKDVMKTDFGTIDGIATVADALKKMKLLKTAVLIVNKRNENDEYELGLVEEKVTAFAAEDDCVVDDDGIGMLGVVRLIGGFH